jgi:hypothetical protein
VEEPRARTRAVVGLQQRHPGGAAE